MSGAWAADQQVSATVYAANQNVNANKEIEIRLRTTITAHSITGYEINWNTTTANPYYEVVRWNGALGDFTPCSHIVAARPPVTGDVVKAKVVGNTLTQYLNGTLLTTIDLTTACGGGGTVHTS